MAFNEAVPGSSPGRPTPPSFPPLHSFKCGRNPTGQAGTRPHSLPGGVAWIYEGFDDIFARLPERHDGTRRTIAGTDSSEELCRLLDHPKIAGPLASLLGDDFNYLGGDANYYVGDTPWHSDGWHDRSLFVRMAFYLDPVGKDTGCLWVILGSHWLGSDWVARLRGVHDPERNFGMSGRDVPAVPLESRPGDVVLFNHNLHHAAYGGNSQRRMFTLNLSRRAETSGDVQELRDYVNGHARFWIERMHSDHLRATESPAVWCHLERVMANEDKLPELSRQTKAAMKEAPHG